jgi:hypothetical protein
MPGQSQAFPLSYQKACVTIAAKCNETDFRKSNQLPLSNSDRERDRNCRIAASGQTTLFRLGQNDKAFSIPKLTQFHSIVDVN